MATLHLKNPLPVRPPVPATKLASLVRLSSAPVIPTAAAEPVPHQSSAPDVASERTISRLARLVRHLPDWVRVIPRRLDDPILPLPLGVEIALAGLLPPGDERALADLIPMAPDRFC